MANCTFTTPQNSSGITISNFMSSDFNISLPVENSLPVNTTVIYECLSDHVLLTGNLTRVCETTGNWSGTEPVCVSGVSTTLVTEPITSTSSHDYSADDIGDEITTTNMNQTTTMELINTESSNIPMYVGIGIMLVVLITVFFLLLDFIRHIRYKLRVIRRSQRKLNDGRPRPDAFMPTSKMKSVYFIQPDPASEPIVGDIIDKTTGKKKRKKRRKQLPELKNQTNEESNINAQYRSFYESNQPITNERSKGQSNKGYDWASERESVEGSIDSNKYNRGNYSLHKKSRSYSGELLDTPEFEQNEGLIRKPRKKRPKETFHEQST